MAANDYDLDHSTRAAKHRLGQTSARDNEHDGRNNPANIASPQVGGGEQILALQRIHGNRFTSSVIQQLRDTTQQTAHDAMPQSRVQRWPNFFKKKPKATDTNTTDTQATDTNANEQEAGSSAGPKTYLTLRAAVKMGTEARGEASLSELLRGSTGHSWLEVYLGPNFTNMAALNNDPVGKDIVSAMTPASRAQFKRLRHTSIGFYPDVTDNPVSAANMAKQMFRMTLPGSIQEPEQDHFAGLGRGTMDYPITSVNQATQLFNTVQAHSSHSYNLFTYNCTDFVVNALKAAGFSPPGKTSKRGVTMPTQLYKRIYQAKELGDASARTTELSSGKKYDKKHLDKQAMKRLAKRKQKLGIGDVVQGDDSVTQNSGREERNGLLGINLMGGQIEAEPDTGPKLPLPDVHSIHTLTAPLTVRTSRGVRTVEAGKQIAVISNDDGNVHIETEMPSAIRGHCPLEEFWKGVAKANAEQSEESGENEAEASEEQESEELAAELPAENTAPVAAPPTKGSIYTTTQPIPVKTARGMRTIEAGKRIYVMSADQDTAMIESELPNTIRGECSLASFWEGVGQPDVENKEGENKEPEGKGKEVAQ